MHEICFGYNQHLLGVFLTQNMKSGPEAYGWKFTKSDTNALILLWEVLLIPSEIRLAGQASLIMNHKLIKITQNSHSVVCSTEIPLLRHPHVVLTLVIRLNSSPVCIFFPFFFFCFSTFAGRSCVDAPPLWRTQSKRRSQCSAMWNLNRYVSVSRLPRHDSIKQLNSPSCLFPGHLRARRFVHLQSAAAAGESGCGGLPEQETEHAHRDPTQENVDQMEGDVRQVSPQAVIRSFFRAQLFLCWWCDHFTPEV